MFGCMLSIAAELETRSVSKSEALLIAQQQFEGRDVDYYIQDAIKAGLWNVFVDAEPMKGWEHECYILQIPKTTTEKIGGVDPIRIEERKTPPTSGNYEPLAVKLRYITNSSTKPVVEKSSQENYPNPYAHRTYALIINGGINKLSNYERYWNDCSFIYQTLVNKYRIPKENIFPLMSDGNNPAADMRTLNGSLKSQSLDLDNDGTNEIELSASKTNIQNTMNILSNIMDSNDHLFIYVIDHGGSTDNNTNSYICLWNNEVLYDYELATMISPFTDNNVNVNVVLGQCFAGGFVDNLTKNGCVVAAASTGSEPSWACSDIPYDEFVYQWTCAVNEADHKNVKIMSDSDGNNRVSLYEAFQYARAHDRQTAEHPQYKSTPNTLGKELAFNYIPPKWKLCVKDNDADVGNEPNTTTTTFWTSPSIWVRNQQDDIEIHENPVRTPDHLGAVVYVKVHNLGTEEYTGGKWLHVYWAKASTGLTDRAWKGRELYTNEHNDQFVTGGHLEPRHIDSIAVGSSINIPLAWALPSVSTDETGPDKHHFCLITKILDTPYDEAYEAGKSYFDVKRYRDQAQKNVSIIPKENIDKGVKVFVRNIKDRNKKYTLELIPNTSADEDIFNRADVEMKLSSKIYNAWEMGGCKSQGVSSPESNTTSDGYRKVRFLEPYGKLQDVQLSGDEFDIVTMKFNFKEIPSYSKIYTLDLVQKDEDGEIIGGETFIVHSPVNVSPGMSIGVKALSGTETQLSVDGSDFKRVQWIDSEGNDLGQSESIKVIPTYINHSYTVHGYTEAGDVAIGSVSLDSQYGIKSVSTSQNSNRIIIELNGTGSVDSKISIVSVMDGDLKIEERVSIDQTAVCIDSSQLKPGLYAIIYRADGIIIDQKKINID